MKRRFRIKTESSSRKKRPFLRLLETIAIVLVIRYVIAIYHDRPLKTLENVTIDSQPDYDSGIGLNFRQKFKLLQEREYESVEDNGWKVIAKTFGSRYLDPREALAFVPWKEYPTNPETTQAYEDFIVPTFKLLGLDANEECPFADSPGLCRFFLENGLDPDPYEKSEESEASEEENVPGPARVDEQTRAYDAADVFEVRARIELLSSRPWKTESYPKAAKWVEENEESFAALADAARRPYFSLPRVISDEPLGILKARYPDFQSVETIANEFAVRAQSRIARGEYSNALDDLETILLLARSYLTSEYDCWFELKTARSALRAAASLCFDGATETPPTLEERERLRAVWANTVGDVNFHDAFLASSTRERDYVHFQTAQDYLQLRREGKLVFSRLDPGANVVQKPFGRFYAKLYRRSVFFRAALDDGAVMSRMAKLLQEKLDELDGASTDEVSTDDVSTDDEATRLQSIKRRLFHRRSLEELRAERLSKIGQRILGEIYEFCRAERLVKTRAIVGALLAYRADKGALPPAFTVDADGRPLQSWRVLILPYLGDEERALYEQIRLDEPWDSEYNSRFVAQIPEVYRAPKSEFVPDGFTTVSALLGDDALFSASGESREIAPITPDDVGGRRALVVERYDPVEWTRPDRELDAASALAITLESSGKAPGAIGSRRNEPDIVVGFTDGSAEWTSLWLNLNDEASDWERNKYEELIYGARDVE